jgi:hypothetical protein
MTPSAAVETQGRSLPFRRTFIGVETALAFSGVAGAVQLWEGTYAPPISNIESLGLESWRLPAVWLFSSVAVPSAVAAVAAARRWPRTPVVVLAASGLLLVEVTVQVPFVGPSVLQAVFGGVAVTMGSLALVAHRSGRWAGHPGGPAVIR